MAEGEQETKTHDLTGFRKAVDTVAERGITPDELKRAKALLRPTEPPATEKRQ